MLAVWREDQYQTCAVWILLIGWFSPSYGEVRGSMLQAVILEAIAKRTILIIFCRLR